AQRVERARGGQISSIKARVETVHGDVHVRYPARGDEDAAHALAYQVEFTADLFKRGGQRIPCTAQLTAPGATKWPKVVAALRAAARAAGYEDPYFDKLVEPDDAVTVWFGQGSGVEPSPTVEQLAGLPSVAITSVGRW